MDQAIIGNHILLGVTGTSVPDSTEKEVEDQLLGGCFPILLLFFFIASTLSLSTFILLKQFI